MERYLSVLITLALINSSLASAEMAITKLPTKGLEVKSVRVCLSANAKDNDYVDMQYTKDLKYFRTLHSGSTELLDLNEWRSLEDFSANKKFLTNILFAGTNLALVALPLMEVISGRKSPGTMASLEIPVLLASKPDLISDADERGCMAYLDELSIYEFENLNSLKLLSVELLVDHLNSKEALDAIKFSNVSNIKAAPYQVTYPFYLREKRDRRIAAEKSGK